MSCCPAPCPTGRNKKTQSGEKGGREGERPRLARSFQMINKSTDSERTQTTTAKILAFSLPTVAGIKHTETGFGGSRKMALI